MKPQTIRIIDLWLGRPLCFALTAARYGGLALRRLGGRPKPPPPVRKILLVKMIEQGATVLAYRAIEQAVRKVGRENVYFWVFSSNRAILDLLGLIPPENVLALRSGNMVSFALDVVRSLWKIRRLGIDATVDMEFFARAPAALAFLTGARRRVGLHRFTTEGPYRGDLLTHRVQSNPYLHTAIGYYMLIEALDSDPGQVPLVKSAPPAIDWAPAPFEPSDADLRAVHQAMREATAAARGRPSAAQGHASAAPEAQAEPEGEVPAPGRRLVLLNPNAGDLLPLRRWPTERFIELGSRLLDDDADVTIAITGAPSERDAAEAVANRLRALVPGAPGRVICMAGRTSLRELIALYGLAELLVTNDSGPGHFASLTELPTLVLFGPETPALFAPLGKATHVMSAGLACSPCVNAMNHRFSPCRDNVCMQELSVGAVWARCRELLRPEARPALELTVLGREVRARAAAPGFRLEPAPAERAS